MAVMEQIEKIIADRFVGNEGKAMTYEQLGLKYRVSRQRIHQILKRYGMDGKLPRDLHHSKYGKHHKTNWPAIIGA